MLKTTNAPVRSPKITNILVLEKNAMVFDINLIGKGL